MNMRHIYVFLLYHLTSGLSADSANLLHYTELCSEGLVDEAWSRRRKQLVDCLFGD